MHTKLKRHIVENALHQACAYIQDQVGNKTGDIAGVFFCGDNEEIIYSIFAKYLETELMHKLPVLEYNKAYDPDSICGKYCFDFEHMALSNFIVSDCARFSVSPEKYGFELVNTGENSMAHSRDFVLDGDPVTVMITDNVRENKAITRETIHALVTLYHTGTKEEIDSYVISR